MPHSISECGGMHGEPMDIIFDVDGTLLDISHRLHFLGLDETTPPSERAKPNASKRWKEFRDPKQKRWDEPILPVILTMNALHVEGHRVIIASGRNKSEGPDTIKTLKRWVPYIDSVPMYMRSDSDYRPDTEAKLGLLHKMRNDGFNPTFAFDDRPSVIRMWREQGLLVADVGKGKEF
jgi:phosphoglycolate phosphatase-like HAD superfamily hydrolase